MINPKVGILTTFTGSDEAYSLVVVVKTQIQMLLDAGYNPVLFAAPSFTGGGIWERIEIRRVTLEDFGGQIADIDVMLCHDILFLSQHKQWAELVRKLAPEFPKLRWLHWQHSRGDHAPIEPMPNSDFCYPNTGDLAHVAQINSTDAAHVHYIPHPLDFGYLGWPELAIRIAEDYNFPFADVSMIYPTRLDRQKQVEKATRVFAGLKRAGKSVCLLVADAYATGDRFKDYKADCIKLAQEQGLTDKEFAFLGEVYPECMFATPRTVVKALFEMSNLFMQVSTSETSSLVAMEAALAGNLLVLNADFKPIHHLYDKALLLPFGSIFEDVKYYRHIKTADGQEEKIEDAQQYWDDQARVLLIPALDSQLTIAVKRQQLRERWPSRVMRDYLNPLLLKDWDPPEQVCTGDPEVTCIITTLDNLPMLKRQIPIMQTEVGHIIVVNNGSIDETKEWLDTNPVQGMTIIHRQNLGAGPGRNAGLAAWDLAPTPYTLMLDGGILPPVGGVAALKAYLERHPEAHVISPEIVSCFTTNEEEALHKITEPLTDKVFLQSYLTSTGYGMCRAEAWKVRFSEEGPFGEAGWGVDDNDLAFRWDKAGVIHHEFTYEVSGWKLYRRQSGSFARLFAETGIWPNQYGSVYEKRNVKCLQDWRAYHGPMYGRAAIPSYSYVIQDVLMPDFARLVKRLHDSDLNCEIIAADYDPEVKQWLDLFGLRWPHGNVTTDHGKIIRRGVDYPEELWSGDVVRTRGPLSPNVITITPANMHENAIFNLSDIQSDELKGYQIDRGWWSRLYEYPWAIRYAGAGMTVADMGCGWQSRPFKDALAKTCAKVYAVDQHWEIRDQQKYDNLEYVIADFTQKIEAIPDDSLDRVFCISVLEELPPEKLSLALAEFYRALKPGGLCVITCDLQYDMDMPLTDFGAVNSLDFRLDILASGFVLREPFYFSRADAVYNANFNLCAFHCVLVKP